MKVEVDVEGSGVIEFEQFIKFIARLNSKEGDLEEEAQYAFNRYSRLIQTNNFNFYCVCMPTTHR